MLSVSLLSLYQKPTSKQDLRITTISSRGERPFAPTDGVLFDILRNLLKLFKSLILAQKG
ncbi:MAG: hypothetical protein SWX82_26935 [Cyanobacteriota bacterium]|nr:hypothetical protein [Cyanobacteriota bacterium]